MNNSITIGTITIHQSANGLYLLTDLWKASGGELKNLPSKYLILKSTKSLIHELGNENYENGVPKSGSILVIESGPKEFHGTYVCKELVYTYAMWINPKFYLLVVRTFDALVNAQTNEAVIAVKNQLNEVQLDMFRREPRDKQSLAVILQVATAKVKPYFDHLVSIGEVGRRWIPQHDKAEYYALDTSRHVIGKKGNTVLFEESVVGLFPQQDSLVK